MFLISRSGGILITADSLQNWTGPDQFFSEVAAQCMGQAGFFKPANSAPSGCGSAHLIRVNLTE